MDHLESQTYEVFEKDPVKYDMYEKVCTQRVCVCVCVCVRVRACASDFQQCHCRIGVIACDALFSGNRCCT